MITRAQAEALLTLAESLEACERLGMTLHVPLYVQRMIVHYPEGGFSFPLENGVIKPMLLRLRIAEEIPRSET